VRVCVDESGNAGKGGKVNDLGAGGRRSRRNAGDAIVLDDDDDILLNAA